MQNFRNNFERRAKFNKQNNDPYHLDNASYSKEEEDDFNLDDIDLTALNSPKMFISDDSIIGDIDLIELQSYLDDLSPNEMGEVIWNLHKDFYYDKPVDYFTFSYDKHFLGGTFEKGHYPLWKNISEQLYPHALFSPYYEIIAETPIGSGKSQWAGSIILYELYKMSLLRDPQRFYNLLQNTLISFTVMSQDLSTVGDVNWSLLEGFITESPYFRNIVALPKGKEAPDELKFPNKVTLKFASKPSHLTGRAIFGGMCDEANVNRYIMAIYNDIIKRMNSRFPLSKNGGIFPGKLLLLSSPKEEGSFMAKRIENKNKFTISITNIPIWEIRDPVNDLNLSGEYFKIFTGTKSKEPFIIKNESQITPEIAGGIADVPIEYQIFYEEDIIESLREFSGIRTAGKGKLFRSFDPIRANFVMPNICSQEIITLDFFNKEDNIINYFQDLDYFKDPWHPHSFRFIHIDVGINNDKLGIACTHAVEKEEYVLDKLKQQETLKTVRNYFIDFCFALKKPINEEVSIPKLIDFIIYLKHELQYPIKLVTTDGFEGKTLKQFLRIHFIDTGLLSLDRNHDVWKFTRAAIILNQVKGPEHSLFFREVMDVEDNGKTFDHPQIGADGRKGSHDLTQAIFGSVFTAGNAETIQMDNAFMSELDDTSILKYGNNLPGMLRRAYNAYNKSNIINKLI